MLDKEGAYSNFKVTLGVKKRKETNTEQKREGEEEERLPFSGQLPSGEQQDPLMSILLSSAGDGDDEEDDENKPLFIPS